jgi:hypothetical protein
MRRDCLHRAKPVATVSSLWATAKGTYCLIYRIAGIEDSPVLPKSCSGVAADTVKTPRAVVE